MANEIVGLVNITTGAGIPDADARYVKTTGDQTVAGAKTFTSTVSLADGSAATPSWRTTTSGHGFFEFSSVALSLGIASTERYRFQYDRIRLNGNATAFGSLTSIALPGLEFHGADASGVGFGIATYASYGRSIFRRADGTAASPAALAAGVAISEISAQGHDGSAFSGGQAFIYCYTDNAWSGTDRSTYWRFRGTPQGSVTSAEWLRLRNGQTLTTDGSSAAPAMSFINDTNTGLYRSAADTLVLVTAGVDALTVSSTQAVSVASHFSQPGGTYHYLRGDATTDGSVRLSSPSAGSFLVEARASGVWSTLFSAP